MLVILYTEFNQFLPKWLINKVEAYVMDNGVYELIVMAANLMAVSWVISTAGYALKYANFKIERNGNEVRIVQGLFDKKEFVLKLHRIRDYGERRHSPPAFRILLCRSRSYSKYRGGGK